MTAGNDFLSAEQARKLILDSITAVEQAERVPLREAPGRVLAEDLLAPRDVPAHDNAAMDGYAIRSQDTRDAQRCFTIAGKAFAGHPFEGHLKQGQAVRIMTGALIPEGADCVVMQEDALVADEHNVTLPAGQPPWQHIRRRSEDLAAGSVAVATGTMLTPAHIGLLASFGAPDIAVRRHLRVAVFTGGDELTEPGRPLEPGHIYDNSRPMLLSALTRLGCWPIDLGIATDHAQAVGDTLCEAAAVADVVLSCGGISVGEADFVRDQLALQGEIKLWKIAIKPGKPLAFGRIGNTLVFGLPGNPVATLVNYYQFVKDALLKMMGVAPLPAPNLFDAECTEPIRKRPGRREFVRGKLTFGDGSPQVAPIAHQSSATLLSMTEANCFIILPEQEGSITPGQSVKVQPFDGLI